ncbi:SsrA-binding protein SmpB [Roseivirga sp. BDSF3-8]|uniref:SsrA-binding protein SmpB n=1 Tax=Roseivirga sp. BDSF3-8 TaxID=3241598 RepID=UPI0035321B7B
MAKDKSKFSNNISIRNRQARYEYEFLDVYIAGMSLKGTEIKSIRMGKVNLSSAFCVFHNDELFVRDLHITPYELGTHENHDAKRERKLLLQRRELNKLKTKLEEKGLTIVPSKLFINDRGLAKLEIALARGKKLHDKRQSIKEKDQKREMSRIRY